MGTDRDQASTPAAREESARPWILFACIVAALAAGLAIYVVILTRQNAALRAEVAAMHSQVATNAGLKPGERIHDLALLDGSNVQLVGTDRPTLVLAASHSCGSCARTLPTWSAMASLIDAASLRVVLLDIDAKAGEPALEVPPPLKALAVRDGDTTWLRGLSVVPAAILIGPDGVVARAWWGEASADGAARLLDEIRGEAARLQPTPPPR